MKNKYNKTVHKKGYIGEGLNICKGKIYEDWHSMMRRCYSEKEQLRQPTYVGCFVDERWHNFQVFAEWHKINYIDGFQLDKDILVKGNKVYGPDTCCFVPRQINNILLKNDSGRTNLPIGVRQLNKRFGAQINKFGKSVSLGVYDNIEDAFEVYKNEKEKYIKELLEIWKDKISEKVFNILFNYEVKITD